MFASIRLLDLICDKTSSQSHAPESEIKAAYIGPLLSHSRVAAVGLSHSPIIIDLLSSEAAANAAVRAVSCRN